MKKLNTLSSIPWSPGDLASFVFPQRCPLCDGVLPFGPRLRAPLPENSYTPDVWVHAACHRRLRPLSAPLCPCCGRGLEEAAADSSAEEIAVKPAAGLCSNCRGKGFHFIQNRALWPYTDPARSALLRFKYQRRQQYAPYLARAWFLRHRAYLEAIRPQALLPVPIHRSRLRGRGYNQAALLAYELEKLSGIPCREDILIRSKHTGAQKALGPSQRLKNMENAFRLIQKPEGIERILIVDDIYTTGSTMEAVSQLLFAGGIREIYGATICIAGPEKL